MFSVLKYWVNRSIVFSYLQAMPYYLTKNASQGNRILAYNILWRLCLRSWWIDVIHIIWRHKEAQTKMADVGMWTPEQSAFSLCFREGDDNLSEG